MIAHFRLKLFLLIISVTIAVAAAIAVSDYLKLRNQAVAHMAYQVAQIEERAREALLSLEKAYLLFDEEASGQMAFHGQRLVEKYLANPSFDTWDFEGLKEEMGLDIYIIDRFNVITHSSFEEDIGLDFNRCCPKLAPRLNELRASGGYQIDGLDMEQKTGHVKKYAYFATPDHEYIIQLGHDVESSLIFEEFNLFKVLDQLVERFPCIEAIHVLNLGGYPLGQPAEEGRVSGERRQAFEHTLTTRETTEVEGTWQDRPVTFRYVPYDSPYDRGSTQYKVLEIIYNQSNLESILKDYTRSFLIKLGLVILGAALVAFFISRWVARLIYLAFHDSLTGLKNRAAFEEELRGEMCARKAREKGKRSSGPDPENRFALLVIDLDNFKEVNDRLGHDQGDRLLKKMAQAIRSATQKGDLPFRLGGDEFVLLLPGADEKRARETASRIIEAVTSISLEPKSPAKKEEPLGVTVSIGIALCPQHGRRRNLLFKHADQALYMAKEKGKNRYEVYAAEGDESRHSF